jgi:hypothetical protein
MVMADAVEKFSRFDYCLFDFDATASVQGQSQQVVRAKIQSNAAFFSFERMCYLGRILRDWRLINE